MMAARRERAAAVLQPIHKMTLIQALMARPYLSEPDCQQLLRRICSTTDDGLYTNAIATVAEDLRFAHLTVKTVKNPVDGIKYVGLVNLQADELSKLATRYTIPQRDYFRAAMDAIATSPVNAQGPGTPCVSDMALLNLDPAPPTAEGAAAPKKFAKQEKQEALRLLVEDGWLATTPGRPGHLCLGARTILELSEYLMSLEDVADDTRAVWAEIF